MLQNLLIADGKWALRTKEVISEQLRGDTGIHDDKHGFLDSKWTAKAQGSSR